MNRFGFPHQYTNCLHSLFYSTEVHINVNGHLSTPFVQGRGLRQGDPISPLLFNIAFEPCLRYLLSSNLLTGFSFSPIRHLRPAILLPPPPPLKLLAYADDLLVVLNSPEELHHLLRIFHLYGLASNSRLNVDKTEVVSLSGAPLTSWMDTFAALNISHIHDRSSANALRYLGYPLSSHPSQLERFFSLLLTKIQRHCDLLRQRRLSIRGQGLVLHALILSRLWHVLTVTPAPSSIFRRIRSICRSYIDTGYPPVSWDSLCLPRSKGGLGLLDPEQQQLALQSRWLQGIFGNGPPSFVYAYLLYDVMQYSAAPTVFHGFFTYGHYSRFPSTLQPLIKACRRLFPTDLFHRRLHITPATAMHIPLQLVILPGQPLPVSSHALAKLSVGDLFTFDPGGSLRLRELTEFASARNTLRALRRAFLQSTLPLASWCLELCLPTAFSVPASVVFEDPLLAAIRLAGNHTFHTITTSVLRRTLNHRTTPATHPSVSIPRRRWLYFWRAPIPHQTRTVWWRLLTNRIPTRHLLHTHMPQVATSSSCVHCQDPRETVSHFFVFCASKRRVWHIVSQRCNSDWSLEEIFHYLSTLQPPQRPHQPIPDLHLSLTLSTIWRHHWRRIFDNHRFKAGTVASLVQRKLLEVSRQPEVLDSQDVD